MGAPLELRNCTPLPVPSRDWFLTPNLYFLILYLQTSPTSKFQLNVCLPWIELHFLFPLQSSVSKWLCSWSVMWDFEKMFPKGAYVCSPSSILLGVVMAGTWAAILHSEAKAVCWGCQSSEIEETLVLKNSRSCLLCIASLHTSFMGERNIFVSYYVLLWIPHCSQMDLILTDITSSNCSFHLVLLHHVTAFRQSSQFYSQFPF